ncbi:Hypothetical Protein FCC1311_114772, partial [Hondaea fermentalgiana]
DSFELLLKFINVVFFFKKVIIIITIIAVSFNTIFNRGFTTKLLYDAIA